MNRTPENERRRQRVRNIEAKLATIRYCLQNGNTLDNPDKQVANALKSLKHYGYDYETNSVIPFRTWSSGNRQQIKPTKRIPLEEERRNAFQWILHKTSNVVRNKRKEDARNAGLSSICSTWKLVPQKTDTATLISRSYNRTHWGRIQEKQVSSWHMKSRYDAYIVTGEDLNKICVLEE